jgi:hypothetical protein
VAEIAKTLLHLKHLEGLSNDTTGGEIYPTGQYLLSQVVEVNKKRNPEN